MYLCKLHRANTPTRLCLRAGEMRPPLTVVLINNAGGGIFSFLPIADQLPPDTFSQLWATPQNVDLAGACSKLFPPIPAFSSF